MFRGLTKSSIEIFKYEMHLSYNDPPTIKVQLGCFHEGSFHVGTPTHYTKYVYH